MKYTHQHIETKIKEATELLIKTANNSCWNEISENCEYIISEINTNEEMNAFERRIYRKKNNELKKTKPLKEIIKEFAETYSNTYTIDLFIYKSKKTLTIIEIQYLLKTKVSSIIENEPSLHCKIGIPPYHKKENEKYDINWELGGITHNWRMLLWRLKYKLWKYKRILKNAG